MVYEEKKGGVSSMDYMRDKYSCYVLKVVEVALNSSSDGAVLEQLVFIRTELMGMDENTEHDTNIASTIFSLVHSDLRVPKVKV